MRPAIAIDHAALQEQEYSFPYHFIPELRSDGSVVLAKSLAWGLEYLTYFTFVRDTVLSLRPASLLDVGCGDGRLLKSLEGKVPRLVGLEVSHRAALFARALCDGAAIVEGPLDTLEEKFDVVTSVEVLEHLPDDEVVGFLGAIRRRVKPRGIAIFSVPSTLRPLNPKHFRHYSERTLRETLSQHFAIGQVQWLYRPCPIEVLLRTILCNRSFALQNRTLGKLIWRLHRRCCYRAEPGFGTHMVAVCKLP